MSDAGSTIRNNCADVARKRRTTDSRVHCLQDHDSGRSLTRNPQKDSTESPREEPSYECHFECHGAGKTRKRKRTDGSRRKNSKTLNRWRCASSTGKACIHWGFAKRVSRLPLSPPINFFYSGKFAISTPPVATMLPRPTRLPGASNSRIALSTVRCMYRCVVVRSACPASS